MILVIGGAFQGKKDYALTLVKKEHAEIIDGETCDMQAIYTADLIDHFHMYVKRMLQQGMDPADLAKELAQSNPDLILVSNELGYGIVPMDKDDRAWREATGRVCTGIAKQCEQVYRVVCGVAMPLLKSE